MPASLLAPSCHLLYFQTLFFFLVLLFSYFNDGSSGGGVNKQGSLGAPSLAPAAGQSVLVVVVAGALSEPCRASFVVFSCVCVSFLNGSGSKVNGASSSVE